MSPKLKRSLLALAALTMFILAATAPRAFGG